MSLIKCKECGKEISDQAITCPNCGARTETTQKNEGTTLCLISLVCTVIGLFINPFALISIIALVLAIISITKIKKSISIIVCNIFFILINISNIIFFVINLQDALNIL